MISRPWAYLAIIATGMIWGMPSLLWWALVAVMAVDLVRRWVHTAAQRLERTLRDPVTGSGVADTVVEDAAGQLWLRSPAGRLTQVCAHEDAVEVRRTPVPAVGVTDDVVAWWCDACKTQLPADWVPGMGRLASPYLNVEQQAKIRAAFLRGAKTRAPVWIAEDWSVEPLPNPMQVMPGATVAEPVLRETGHVCDPVRCRTARQIETSTGRHAIEVTAIGDPHRMFVPGRILRCPHCDGSSISDVHPEFCLDCGRSVAIVV